MQDLAKGIHVKNSDFISPVKAQLDEFETALEQKLNTKLPLAGKIVQYISGKRGKRLRPVLVFLTAGLHGVSNKVTLASGLVIELLHTATLIHDDVVDESDLRRGSPTVNSLWNSKISILVGDFIFSKSLTTMVEMQSIKAIDILGKAANEITEGELLQMDHEYLGELSESVYFELITKKTASLFSASCQLGALSITEDELVLKRMHLLGENMGIAFQITDDLLDYTGDVSKLGKPVGNDIKEQKITLPLIYALNKAESKIRTEILDRFENVSNDEDIKYIIDFANDYGGVEHSRQTAKSFADKATLVLSFYPDSAYKHSLIQLLNYSIDRDV